PLSWGRDREGGIAEPSASAVPPPLAPPHTGEGNARVAVVSGEPNPEGPIWQADAFHTDAWLKVADGDAIPEAPVVLSRARGRAERERLTGRNSPLGLRLEPGEGLDDIAADLPRFALIALSFPKFVDGRAFSTATLLREKHRFAGELRAVGNVLS